MIEPAQATRRRNMMLFLSPPNRCCGSSWSFCSLPSSSLVTTLNHNLSLHFLLVASSLSLRSPAIAKKERTKRSLFTSHLLKEIDQRLHLPSFLPSATRQRKLFFSHRLFLAFYLTDLSATIIHFLPQLAYWREKAWSLYVFWRACFFP